MSILWLGKRFYTNKDALRERFGRIYQLPRYWQAMGQEVRLWLVDYHTRESVRADDGGMQIVSAPAFSRGTFRQMLATVMVRRADCIVASGDCYLGMLGWLLARLSGAAFVFDVYDKYDEFAGYRRFPWFDPFSFLLRHADGLIFASQTLPERLAMPAAKPFHVAPNGVDAALFRAGDMLESRRILGLPPDIALVGYFGSMEPDRGVADLIAAVAKLRESGTPVELLLAGKAAGGLNLSAPWIRYLGMVPHTQMPLLLNACDIVTVPYRLGAFMDMGASCKIAEYLACRRPVVATATPNFSANFPVQAAALGPALCRASDPQDLARALAYQLKARIVPPLARNLHWETIAETALRWLQDKGHAYAVHKPASGKDA